jgi:branched-subunit amino acid ABC-type transport system permease component
MPDFLQFLFSGLTTGSIYALSGMGMSIIYKASGVINFAQGDFLMIGGMATVVLLGLGLPLPLAILIAIVVTVLVGAALQRFALAPAGDADVLPLLIITIGASIFIQGVVQLLLGKNQHTLPPFSGETPIIIGGASLLPQSLWVMGVGAVLVVLMAAFFRYTLLGKAIRATAVNRMAAQLLGINTRFVLLISFCLAALLGGLAGIVAAPITTTSYDLGLMLGMKGFVAATLGGLGSAFGAVAGGLILGILEAMIAGYVSSAYKDAVPFVLIILILLLMPNGLFGATTTERV